MSDRLSLAPPGVAIAPQWRQRASQRRIGVVSASAILLTFLAYLTLYRATGMWFGYPTAQSSASSVDPKVMQLILYSTIPLTGAYFALRSSEVVARIQRASLAAFVIAFFVLVSVLFSQSLSASVRGFAAFAALTAPMILYRWRFGLAGYIDFLRTFAIITAVISLVYLIVFPRYAIMTGVLAGSVRGMFMHKNMFGEFCAIGFVALLPPYPGSSVLRKATCLVGLALCAVCVVLSLSSTAIVLAMIGPIVVVASSVADRIRGRSYRAVITAITFLMAIPLFIVLNTLIIEIIATSFGKDMTLSGRTDIWGALWPHLFDYPLTGHGFTMMRQHGYMEEMVQNVGWVVHSTHNSYLEILLNIGLVGGIGFILFVLARFFTLIVDDRPTPRDRVAKGRAAAIIVLILIGAMTEAGDLLTPGTVWPILAGLLTLDRPSRARAETRRRAARR